MSFLLRAARVTNLASIAKFVTFRAATTRFANVQVVSSQIRNVSDGYKARFNAR